MEVENSTLRAKQSENQGKIDELTDRVISLEGYMRRDNLKFINIILQSPNIAQENCEDIIHSLCKDLDVPLSENSIVRAHRTGAKRNGS